MKIMITFLTIVNILCFIQIVFAAESTQNYPVSYERTSNLRSLTLYDTSNSPLPSNIINCITLDGNINKWIGTPNGLVKYDGNTWSIYNTSNSGMSGNNVTAVAIDTDDFVWIASSDGNLVSFDGNQWITYEGITGIHSLKSDTQGDIWVGRSSLVSEFSHGGWLDYTTLNSGIPQSIVNSIVFDFLNGTWLGTESAGLVRYDGSNWTAYNQLTTNKPINATLSMLYSAQNELWIGTSNHAVCMFDGIDWISYSSLNSPFTNNASISCISQGNTQAIWFGTTNQGLIKKNGTQWTAYTLSDSTFLTNEITALAVDNADVRWVGTTMGLIKQDNFVAIEPNDPNVSVPDLSLNITCYPNPFNPSITLKYDLSDVQKVELEIYNVRGEKVRTLANEYQQLGQHQSTWDGLDQNNNNVSSGMYLCKLKVGNRQVTKKIMLVK